jgi:hypothetical protein
VSVFLFLLQICHSHIAQLSIGYRLPSPAPCKPLQSRDIAYVDEATHTYLLADRSNAAIDVFDTLTNSFVKFLQPTDPFAGVQPASVPTGSGPNLTSPTGRDFFDFRGV